MTGDVPMGSPPPAPGRPGAGPEAYPGTPPILDQPFDADSLYALRAAAAAHASQAGMAEGRCGDLVIAIHELAANAVRHGAGMGQLRMWNIAGALHCRVSDDGAPQPRSHAGDEGGVTGPAAQDMAAAWPYQHGHGLWMVGQVADQFSLRSGRDGTIGTVVFALPTSGPRPAFRLTKHTRDGCTVLELAGDLDQRSAPELTAAVHALLTTSPVLRLVLDLAALTLWDSAGIAALITAQQHINDNPPATMILAGTPGQFRQRLHATGLTSQFTLADTTGQALGQITPPE
jgi:anti-anti-sigma factor